LLPRLAMMARCAAIRLQRQRSADFWFMPHEMLFAERSAAIGNVAAVIVDESALRASRHGRRYC
jgi:hypothetical protein